MINDTPSYKDLEEIEQIVGQARLALSRNAISEAKGHLNKLADNIRKTLDQKDRIETAKRRATEQWNQIFNGKIHHEG